MDEPIAGLYRDVWARVYEAALALAEVDPGDDEEFERACAWLRATSRAARATNSLQSHDALVAEPAVPMEVSAGSTDRPSDVGRESAATSSGAGEVRELLQGMTTRLDALRTEMSELRSGQPKVSPRPFLSLREAARRLGVSRNSTLVDLIADRRIKTVRVNGRVKVPASEVERVIREASR